MYDTDDRSEWTREAPRPTEKPQLVEYDWVHERKPEKQIPIEIIEAILAELDDEDEVTPGLH